MRNELCYISNIEKISENIYSINGSSTIQLYYGLKKTMPGSKGSYGLRGLLPKSLDPSIDELLKSPVPRREDASFVRSTTIEDRFTSTSVKTHPQDPSHPIPHIDMNMWVTGEDRSNFYKRRLDKRGNDI